jgi:hypothetical protein
MSGGQSEAKRNNPKEKVKVLSGAWEKHMQNECEKGKKISVFM